MGNIIVCKVGNSLKITHISNCQMTWQPHIFELCVLGSIDKRKHGVCLSMSDLFHSVVISSSGHFVVNCQHFILFMAV